MADPVFMTLMLHDQEDAYMRKTPAPNAAKQPPRQITFVLLNDAHNSAASTITVDTPDSYESAIDLAFDAFPYDLQAAQREDISFALARPRRGGGVMAHAAFRRTDDGWMNAMRHMAHDQFVQVIVDWSILKPTPHPYSHTISRAPNEKAARSESGSCGTVRRMMKSLVKFN